MDSLLKDSVVYDVEARPHALTLKVCSGEDCPHDGPKYDLSYLFSGEVHHCLHSKTKGEIFKYLENQFAFCSRESERLANECSYVAADIESGYADDFLQKLLFIQEHVTKFFKSV